MTAFRLVSCLILCALSGYLAANTYQQWRNLGFPEAQAPNQSNPSWNLFSQAQNDQLVNQAHELRREMEFNLWPDEQRQLRTSLVDNIRTRIKLSPLKSGLWLEMINAQHNGRQLQGDYSANLGNAIHLHGWQHKATAQLAYHCVHNKPYLTKQTLEQCQSLLAQPFVLSAIGNVQRKIGIDRSQFELLIKQASDAQ